MLDWLFSSTLLSQKRLFSAKNLENFLDLQNKSSLRINLIWIDSRKTNLGGEKPKEHENKTNANLETTKNTLRIIYTKFALLSTVDVLLVEKCSR